MYARTLHTLMHIQHEDMPSNTGPPVERCAILTADFFCMFGTFQSLTLKHNKLKFHMYVRVLITNSYTHSVQRCAILAEFNC